MALSFNPEDLPVLGRDSHLPPVEASRIAPAAIRGRFASPLQWQPEITTEKKIIDRPPADASVLIPIVVRDEPTVLLTLRTDHLHDHPSQISFPGGRTEPRDADAVATALREAEEEIGLAAEWVEVVGNLPIYTTSTGFVVTPVVGLVTPGFTLTPDPFEVAEIFEVPLAWLMDPANHQRHAIETGGFRREFFSLPWPGKDSNGLSRRYFIWGATAAMLRNLYGFFSA